MALQKKNMIWYKGTSISHFYLRLPLHAFGPRVSCATCILVIQLTDSFATSGQEKRVDVLDHWLNFGFLEAEGD